MLGEPFPVLLVVGAPLIGLGTLLAAFDRGSVSIVSPLNATGSLWAVLLTALVIGRSDAIGPRTIFAGILITGGALTGALRWAESGATRRKVPTLGMA